MEVETKTTKIYNSMKPKYAAEIFNQMIIEVKLMMFWYNSQIKKIMLHKLWNF